MRADEPALSDLILVAEKLQRAMEETGRPHCLIGGFAVQRWGEPRVTRDVDAMVYTHFGPEREVAELLLSRFEPRHKDPVAFAALARVVLLQEADTGMGIDVALGAFEYDLHAAQRATVFDFEGGVPLRTCSAEDLMVYKAFAGRPIDLNDIKGILIRQRGKLDLSLVDAELAVLAELAEDPDMVTRWEALRDRHR